RREACSALGDRFEEMGLADACVAFHQRNPAGSRLGRGHDTAQQLELSDPTDRPHAGSVGTSPETRALTMFLPDSRHYDEGPNRPTVECRSCDARRPRTICPP